MGSSFKHGVFRAGPRYKLFEPVRLHFRGAWSHGHLLDLSSSGALAHAERPPQPGDAIRVEGEGWCLSGDILWARARRFGIGLTLPLAEATLLKIVEGGSTLIG